MKFKKLIVLLLSAVMVFAFTACGGSGDSGEEAPADNGVLLMATTTSTEDTGLLDYLQPLFKDYLQSDQGCKGNAACICGSCLKYINLCI